MYKTAKLPVCLLPVIHRTYYDQIIWLMTNEDSDEAMFKQASKFYIEMLPPNRRQEILSKMCSAYSIDVSIKEKIILLLACDKMDLIDIYIDRNEKLKETIRTIRLSAPEIETLIIRFERCIMDTKKVYSQLKKFKKLKTIKIKFNFGTYRSQWEMIKRQLPNITFVFENFEFGEKYENGSQKDKIILTNTAYSMGLCISEYNDISMIELNRR